jgi:GrpB-like predicted nucleotidyltransferase (UPF0157 family)
MNADPVQIAPYDPGWPVRFRIIGARLRDHLGDMAQRIDHIGSTAVPGLAAKPVIDIQIAVIAFEPFDPILFALEDLGYMWREHNPDLTRRMFRDADPRTAHIHVRVVGSFGEQMALVFRDYLRAHPTEADAYAALKMRLAAQYHHQRAAYTDGKEPFIWGVLQRAHRWTQATGWVPGPSDA